MGDYYLGIDNGGTMCKAVLFDKKGREIASSSSKLELLTPEAGFTERDMEELWKVNCGVTSRVIAGAPVEPGEIRGIACTGHGKGLYLWGKDGKPVCNGIVSTDGRAWMYPEQWTRDGTAEKVFEKTCQQILACQPVSLLCWLRDHKPEVLAKIRWIFEVKDYIRFRLTGEAWAEITDYSGSNMLNLNTKQFDPDLLALYGLEELYDALPPVKGSTDICGSVTQEAAKLTGLKENTPVAGGMFDIDACAVAMNIVSEDYIGVIAGTWSINEYISKKPVLNHSVMMNSIYCLDEYYLIEESSPTSAGNLEWYVDTFLAEEKKKADADGVSIYEYCNDLVEKVKPEEQEVIFLPYIFGSNYNAKARACFIGMDSSQSRAHIVRSVYEGIVFCHMVHIEKLLLNRSRTEAIRLAGGAAKSVVWAQMFADVSGLPVEIIDTDELGTLGCAMAAAVSAGTYPDLQSAAGAMVSVKKRIEPRKAYRKIYRAKYTRYRQVAKKLEGLW